MSKEIFIKRMLSLGTDKFYIVVRYVLQNKILTFFRIILFYPCLILHTLLTIYFSVFPQSLVAPSLLKFPLMFYQAMNKITNVVMLNFCWISRPLKGVGNGSRKQP